MERYKELEQRLTKMQNHLDEQINALNNSTSSDFHRNLIELMNTYPELKEFIQFVVSINDKLETRNEVFKELIYNSLREIINIKQQAVMELIKELAAIKQHQEKQKSWWETIKPSLLQKQTLITIAFIIGVIGLFVVPDQIIHLATIIFTGK